MEKRIKYFLFISFIMCFVTLKVKAGTECTFEKDLTITFDDNGSPSINESFWPKDEKNWVVFKSELSDKINITTPQLESQLTDFAGFCPSKIYYCKVKVISFDSPFGALPSNVLDLLDSATVWEGFKNAVSIFLPQITEEKGVYLGATEEDVDGKELFIKLDTSESGEEAGIGYDLVDIIVKAKNGELSIPRAAAEIIAQVAEIVVSGGAAGINYKWQECGYLDYTGNEPTYNLACENSTLYLKDYKSGIDNFKGCSNDAFCKSKELNKLKRIEEKTKIFCDNILENYDNDGEVEGECIDQCLTIAELMNTMKTNAGINKGNVGSCGFSARLLSWGRNIVKWVKYIIPVVLIVLGILDFIRAITKDKEEEMKKAQDKFIKRLIAAALIFIIPFILGFVLDKMGFGDYIDGCDVIEELNDY